jgi:hypothetical protein
MVGDMTALAGTVSVIGGPVVYVASLARAVAMSPMAYSEPPFAIYGSPALAANDLIAIATKGLASAVDTAPELDTTKVSTVHMEDATPAPIASPGSPPAIAAPARSLWQSASVGIKLRFNVD